MIEILPYILFSDAYSGKDIFEYVLNEKPNLGKPRAKTKGRVVEIVSSSYSNSKPRIVKNKIGRNDPCSCGSGFKFKKCCGK
jgi:uncharacterized protein YecA (UPF0149 family)